MRLRGRDGTERFGAFGAGADGAEMVVAVDTGGVPIRKAQLHGVVADDGGGLCSRLGFEHRQSRKDGTPGRCRGGEGFFFAAFVVARGAGTLLAQIGKVVVTGVAIGPDDVDASAGFHVNLNVARFLSRIERNGHTGEGRQLFSFPLQQSPGGMGLPCGQVFGWPRKVQMR